MTNQSTMSKCLACGQTTHTTTTCNNGRVGSLNLFGVQIDPKLDQEKEADDDDLHHPMHKSKSMEILNVCNDESGSAERGYESDDPNVRCHNVNDRKKGVIWTEDEHRSFLRGLEKLGKGNWRGISKNYVPSRTPTQVASHAQKYFIRTNAKQEKGKRRSSLFDLPSNEPIIKQSMAQRAPPVTTVLPPVAPMVRTSSLEDFNRLSYMMGYPNIRNMQGLGDPNCSPMLSYIPLVNYPYQERVYPITHCTERFAALAPFKPQPLCITNGEERITQIFEVDKSQD